MTSPITDARLKEILARAREVRESSIGATPMVAIKLMATYAAEVVPVHVVQAIVSELIAAREALRPGIPREPTEAMIQAGLEALRTEGYTPIDRDPIFVWRAMWHEAEHESGEK